MHLGGSWHFEKLDVWQEAIAFADLIYKVTTEFPDSERFGLPNQMRRAAVSISSNIAEGCSHLSRVDFARFVEIAAGSFFETVSQARISLNQKFLSPDACTRICSAAQKQSRMLSGLRRSLVRD
jgi:four helix bundle protein